MKRAARLLVVLTVGMFACGDDGEGGAVPTIIPRPTATATMPLPTSTHTVTATPSPTSTATSTTTPLPVGAQALFSVDPFDPANPFPSDRLLGDDGHVAVTGEMFSSFLPQEPRYNAARAYFDLIAEQLRTLSGFSTFGPVRVKFDGPVREPDPADADAVMLLSYEAPPLPAPISVTAVSPEVAGEYAIEIRPLLPLAADSRYVFVVTTALVDAHGVPVRPSAELTAALAGQPELSRWRATLDPILEYLDEERGIEPEGIAAIDFFTTQSIADDLLSIRTLFDNGTLPIATPSFAPSQVPNLSTGIFPEGSPEFTALVGEPTSDRLAAVGVGTFPSFDFRFGPQREFDPARVRGETIPTTNLLDFCLAIPDGPPSANGYPLVIFGHGLGGSGTDAIDIAAYFTEEPTMVIGISDVEHGRRGSVSQFFNLVDVFATREHFRQTLADYLQLERMVRNATVPPFDQVDKARISYMGVSLGGIMGAAYMAYEPEVRVGMLSVPGGGLPNIIQSEAIGALLTPLLAQVTAVPLNDPVFPVLVHRFTQVAQWAIDPADPVNVAPFVIDPERRLPGVPPKRILVHEGIADTVVPNATTEALVLAMGLPDVKQSRGCANSAGCSGIWRFVMSEYGQPGDSGHSVTFVIPQAMQQATHFLLSDGTEIIDASPEG